MTNHQTKFIGKNISRLTHTSVKSTIYKYTTTNVLLCKFNYFSSQLTAVRGSIQAGYYIIENRTHVIKWLTYFPSNRRVNFENGNVYFMKTACLLSLLLRYRCMEVCTID